MSSSPVSRLSDYARLVLSPAGQAILAMADNLNLRDMKSLAGSIGISSSDLHRLLIDQSHLSPANRAKITDWLGPTAAAIVLAPQAPHGVAPKTPPGASLVATATARSTPSSRSRTTTQPVVAAMKSASRKVTQVRAAQLVRRGAKARGRIIPVTPEGPAVRRNLETMLAQLLDLEQQSSVLNTRISALVRDIQAAIQSAGA